MVCHRPKFQDVIADIPRKEGSSEAGSSLEKRERPWLFEEREMAGNRDTGDAMRMQNFVGGEQSEDEVEEEEVGSEHEGVATHSDFQSVLTVSLLLKLQRKNIARFDLWNVGFIDRLILFGH